MRDIQQRQMVSCGGRPARRCTRAARSGRGRISRPLLPWPSPPAVRGAGLGRGLRRAVNCGREPLELPHPLDHLGQGHQALARQPGGPHRETAQYRVAQGQGHLEFRVDARRGRVVEEVGGGHAAEVGQCAGGSATSSASRSRCAACARRCSSRVWARTRTPWRYRPAWNGCSRRCGPRSMDTPARPRRKGE